MIKKNDRSRTTVLLIGVVVSLLALLLVYACSQLDLGHKVVQLTYKKVSTYEDLAAIADKPDGKYLLTQDIDMAGRDWTPFTFTGTLDGNGHSISETLRSPLCMPISNLIFLSLSERSQDIWKIQRS